MILRHLLLPTALLAAGCGGERTPPAEAPPAPAPAETAAPAPASPDVSVRGVVILEPTMTFRPCDGGPIVSLLDSTSNRLKPAIGLGGSTEEQGLFVLGRGTTSPQRELILREIEYAVRPSPGAGCDQPPSDYVIAIRGTDAGWNVVVRPQAIEYLDATGAESIRFAGAGPTDSGGLMTYSTTTEFGPSHTLQIVLTPGSCREAKSGAWSPFQASVTLDGKSLRGCAWRGSMR